MGKPRGKMPSSWFPNGNHTSSGKCWQSTFLSHFRTAISLVTVKPFWCTILRSKFVFQVCWEATVHQSLLGKMVLTLLQVLCVWVKAVFSLPWADGVGLETESKKWRRKHVRMLYWEPNRSWSTRIFVWYWVLEVPWAKIMASARLLAHCWTIMTSSLL